MKIFYPLIFVLLSMPVFASETAKREQVIELMELTDADAMMEAMYSQMEIMIQNMSTQLGVQPSEQMLFDEFVSRMTLVYKEEMGWEKFKEPMIQLYTETFTEKEIQGMVDFYKSEVGQSTLKKQPVVMQKSMQLGQSLAMATIPKIQVLAKELEQELKQAREKKVDSKE